MISIVVPAHNEATVIDRCLRAILRDARPGELDVVVAANGCTDETESIVAAFGPPVRLVSISRPSKVAALNAGDSVAVGFPRLYVDADVELDTDAIRAVAAAVEGPYLAASPELFVDTRASSRIVQSYYRLWSRLPSVKNDLVGRGVYAVSEVGRTRFDSFPDVINDDHFFRELFAPAERTIAASGTSRVCAPRTASSLIKRKTRVHTGNQTTGQSTTPISGVVAVLKSEPWRIVDVPAFAAVGAVARMRSRRLARNASPVEWGRDDSRE